MINFIFSKKILVIITVICLIVISAFFVYNSKLINSLTITGINGEKIKINNIEKLKSAKKIGANEIVLEDTPEYIISFYLPDQSFSISIMDKNFQTIRQKAEKRFLQIIGLSASQACNIKLTLGTPAFVNEELAGGNYGLSFCPNALSL